MKTSLHFEAPGDLSVGTVRISSTNKEIADWVATPDKRTFVQEDLAPGIYSAEIRPAGVMSQSVVFQVHEGHANTVVLPTFSTLSSSGNNISFYDTESRRAVVTPPTWAQFEIVDDDGLRLPLAEENSDYDEKAASGDRSKELANIAALTEDADKARNDGDLGRAELAEFSLRAARQDIARDEEGAFSDMREEKLPSPRTNEIEISNIRRRISVGLSEEERGREAFDTFSGRSKLELIAGRLEIDLPTDPKRDLWAGHRVRLTAAIESIRIERCLLPLYADGTKIIIAAPTFASADLEISIMPADPKVRALVRALDAGTSAEATAVRDDVLDELTPATLLDDNRDPWTAILVALLTIRFPDVFRPVQADWIDSLIERAGWAFDVYVVRASHALSTAMAVSGERQIRAVSRAISSLAQAYVAGSPYFRYTNQLVAEMMVGIYSFLNPQILERRGEHLESFPNRDKPYVSSATSKQFARLYDRWRRELPLQRGAGPTFTWLARDLRALKERKTLTPLRTPSGRLRGRDTLVIFEGQVGAGQIAIGAGQTQAVHRPHPEPWAFDTNVDQSYKIPENDSSWMPAFFRSPGPQADPNKGRFGGEASRNGFRLDAAFEKTDNRNWVNIILTIEADRSAKIGLGDYAWFMLHPTFSPPALKVTFRGNRAQLRLRASGGFTVGVWLPSTQTELESDLAEMADAPHIIRTR